ncbi:MAG: hypothetical protein NTX45_09610, partial [Proteobacteria bacterium]|nr:hypothetical protein [Pseudomonadota bacterium]
EFATNTTQFNDDYLDILADTLHRQRDIFMAHLNYMIYMTKLMTGNCWKHGTTSRNTRKTPTGSWVRLRHYMGLSLTMAQWKIDP